MLLRARQFEFVFPRPALVMGVVNVTPDSFFDGGKFFDSNAAVEHGLKLVEQGAQMLIVPTMDVSDWGRHQHELHSRVARVRAAEYGIPIFRVASSGISQAVDGDGNVIAHTSIGSNGEIFSARLRLPSLPRTLPVDRYLAPACTLMSAVVLVLLLLSSIRRTNAG